ncbi:MAG: hypothetical protein COV44_05555 [Deltaproteobacteria bacterium CG11_big_fil_rev_8_21_14_0_20_45_16]|nr:MAG: hypothetical protein COV44_05555 [Deltaproteobacteria bacterium CG11_big_fil_rev_8_21_14_0_20_45_16]
MCLFADLDGVARDRRFFRVSAMNNSNAETNLIREGNPFPAPRGSSSPDKWLIRPKSLEIMQILHGMRLAHLAMQNFWRDKGF